ncbi:phosphoribosylanthranilate isomerase [Acetobacteraceae bacterium H6797]|nr:phosphoribosylanthranilate isomerase [Acetobacteraceae bacterium H6797]
MAPLVKICGLKEAVGFDAACRAGADLIGFVFYPPSPRYVTPAQAAELAARCENGPLRVGLVVDPTDELLAEILAAVKLDLIQLHGHETPERVSEIRARFGVPVMKAIGIGGAEDLAQIATYAAVADRLLIDTKPPKGAALPGGNAASFDWSLLSGVTIPVPWLLAGGLTRENVGEALRITGAPGVDLSSGVERVRGLKDPALVAAFVQTVHAVGALPA